MKHFKRRARYFRFLPAIFTQAQFAEFENLLLVGSATRPQLRSFPRLTLRFSLPLTCSHLEISRILHVFRRTFNVKPSLRPVRNTYCIEATFAAGFSNCLLGFFMWLRAYSRTKFLRFFFNRTGPDFQFLLYEPITFFPLVHPGFDYHDWAYPFEFLVNFGATSDSATHLRKVVLEVFKV